MRVRRIAALALLAAVLGGGASLAVAVTDHGGSATDAARTYPFLPKTK